MVSDFAETLKSYRISQVRGDRYAGERPKEAFQRHGIAYLSAEKPKSDLYRDALPQLNSKNVALLDLPKLTAQLVSLERRTSRGGREIIDHPPSGKDDLANAVCGALLLIPRCTRIVWFTHDSGHGFMPDRGSTSIDENGRLRLKRAAYSFWPRHRQRRIQTLAEGGLILETQFSKNPLPQRALVSWFRRAATRLAYPTVWRNMLRRFCATPSSVGLCFTNRLAWRTADSASAASRPRMLSGMKLSNIGSCSLQNSSL